MFFNKNKEYSYSLNLALKSSSIDVLLIKNFPNAKKEVVFSQQVAIFLESSEDSQKYIENYFFFFKKFFVDNLINLKGLAGGKIEQINFVLYSPWFTSKLDTFTHKDNAYIDEEFIKEKLKSVKSEKNLKILERRVIKLEANGYTLFDIKKIKYPEVCLTTYTSFISKDIYKKIKAIFEESFPEVKAHTFTSSPLLTLQNIRQFMMQEDNIVFFNIGEEITEIGVIQDDSLSYFVTFPKGIHDFLRIIQTSVKGYDYDLLYQKEIFLKDPDQNKKLDQIRDIWVNYVSQSLNLFSTHIPNKIVLITHKKTESFFIELLQNSIKTNKIKGLENHRIISFDIFNLKDIISFKTPVGENSIDLILEALI